MIISDKVIEILKRYAEEKQIIIRSTSDLSPFEEWLLCQLIKSESRLNMINEI